MSALAKIPRVQLPKSLFSSRFQETRASTFSNTVSIAVFSRCKLVRQFLTRPFSPTPRFFSTTRRPTNDDETGASSVALSNPSRRLFVGNIPNKVTISEVQDTFWPFGRLSDFRTSYRPGGSANRGFAHVEFDKLEDAIAAYESHQTQPLWLQNRVLVLSYAKELKKISAPPCHALYFREFQGDMKSLQDVLKKYARHVVCIHFRQPKEGNAHNHGRIYFRSEAIATEALRELNGKIMENGVEIKLDYARLQTRPRPSLQSHLSSTKD